ncbi:DUF4168 domain-containing protein [Lujinxingia sediminis]|uniref:DUF4168 domain-containing protein n=2 Tax=Lujinxingia sediminis TaxID=2480984 RepID=A0ABY0CW44_9DELT|nr:DUF4168 domain-containing protein [Lujinxingia sediminis]
MTRDVSDLDGRVRRASATRMEGATMKLKPWIHRHNALRGLLLAFGAAGLMACEVDEKPDLQTEPEVSAESAGDESKAPEVIKTPEVIEEPEVDDEAASEDEAASSEGAQAPAAPEVEQEEFDDAQVKAFARAFMAMQPVQAEVQKKMASVQSPEDVQKVQQEAISRLQSVVEESGMAFEDYTMFAQRLERDTTLQKRFEAELLRVLE